MPDLSNFQQQSQFFNQARREQQGLTQQGLNVTQIGQQRQLDIARGGFDAARRPLIQGFDQARNVINRSQGGIEGALTGGAFDANQQLSQGEGSALRALQAGTGLGVGALDPFAQAGGSSQQLAAALTGGLGPEAQAEAFANFQESSGQDFLRQRGERATLQNAAATGGLGGGNVQAELNRQGIGFAAQSLNDRISQLTGLGAQGLQAAGQQGSLFGQAGIAGAGIRQQGASQRAQNLFGTGQAISQARGTRANLLSQLGLGKGQALSGLSQQQRQQLLDITGQGTQQRLGVLGQGQQLGTQLGIQGLNLLPQLIAAENTEQQAPSILGQLAGGLGTAAAGFLGRP